MRGGFHPYLAAGAAALALSVTGGCVQATRHSNTMLFGTNTSFGIKAGATTGQVPQVTVGYDRQEAVVMPLWANTADSGGRSGLLQPCVLPPAPALAGGPMPAADADDARAVNPCLFAAYREGALDSYSVLASFGARFGADGGNPPKAQGGLAQYFATGMAAQILAIKGGAAVVAVGEAAEQSAATSDTAALTTLLTGDVDLKVVEQQIAAERSFGQRLQNAVRGTSAADLAGRLQLFETRAGVAQQVASWCQGKTPDECATIIGETDLYATPYRTKAAALEKALSEWNLPAQ